MFLKFFNFFHRLYFSTLLFIFSKLVYAADAIGIGEVDDMLTHGQNALKVAAKWGGIATVVGAALALGSGRMEGALAQTICKILIVIGLLVAAMSFFAKKIVWGFSF